MGKPLQKFTEEQQQELKKFNDKFGEKFKGQKEEMDKMFSLNKDKFVFAPITIADEEIEFLSMRKAQLELYEYFQRHNFNLMDDPQEAIDYYTENLAKQNWTCDNIVESNKKILRAHKTLSQTTVTIFIEQKRFMRSEFKPDIPPLYKNDYDFADSDDMIRKQIETSYYSQNTVDYSSNFFILIEGPQSCLLFNSIVQQKVVDYLDIIPISKNQKSYENFHSLIQEYQSPYTIKLDDYLKMSFSDYLEIFGINPSLIFQLQQLSEFYQEKNFNDFSLKMKNFLKCVNQFNKLEFFGLISVYLLLMQFFHILLNIFINLKKTFSLYLFFLIIIKNQNSSFFKLFLFNDSTKQTQIFFLYDHINVLFRHPLNPIIKKFILCRFEKHNHDLVFPYELLQSFINHFSGPYFGKSFEFPK